MGVHLALRRSKGYSTPARGKLGKGWCLSRRYSVRSPVAVFVMDCESCCSWKAEADPARRRDQKLLIFEEILRRLGSREEAGSPGFGDELWAHFNRLPTR